MRRCRGRCHRADNRVHRAAGSSLTDSLFPVVQVFLAQVPLLLLKLPELEGRYPTLGGTENRELGILLYECHGRDDGLARRSHRRLEIFRGSRSNNIVLGNR